MPGKEEKGRIKNKEFKVNPEDFSNGNTIRSRLKKGSKPI